MSAPVYSYSEFQSDTYRWRADGRILVYIFSQRFPLGNADKRMYWKITEENDHLGTLDVDVMALRRLFHKNKELFPVPVDIKYRASRSFDEFQSCVQEIDGQEEYDCFFFIFLTYNTPDYGNSYNEDKIHFNDRTLEKGVIPQAKVIDEVMKLKVAVGKPKIFLIQADDISYYGPKQYMKGPTFVPDFVNMKIPQDADRLIIKSTIPQHLANLDSSGNRIDGSKKPSLLVDAFVETLLNNLNKKPAERKDLYSLTTSINGKVCRQINQLKHERKGDMNAPLITSTLSKFLNM